MNQDEEVMGREEASVSEMPIRRISISAEQAAPMADLTAFAQQLAAFTSEDYLGDAPYELLVSNSQFSWNQYDQFAAVLLKAALAAGADAEVVRNTIGMYRDIYMTMPGDDNDILSVIRAAVQDEANADKVSVLSIPCGSGKSTALTKLICDVIRRDDGKGLIIVTDSTKRMDEYWNEHSSNPGLDEGTLRFIAQHRDDVAVINRENYEQMKRRQYYAPVIVLTTQRYFSWTQERVREMLRWKNGERPLIIFDEAPYLCEERDVTADTLNIVASALRMRIEATDEESRTKKQKAIAFWEEIRAQLLA